MATPKSGPPPPRLPHPGLLMRRIRHLAREGKFEWKKHAFARNDLRDIDVEDVREVLRLGEIEGPIRSGQNPGEWKCKVTATPESSSRKLGVVTVVVGDAHMLLITVEWEDK